jgi:hypothetical protein
MERPTRRHALRRGLLAAGGLVGIGAARVAGASGRTGNLRLVAPHLDGPGRSHAAPGAQTASVADLFDRAGGRRVGEVHVAAVPVFGPGRSAPDRGAMEWHTFHLDGGTIVGSGTAGTEGGAFAVVGGTGRFANARGTYELRRLADRGAEFVLRLEP